MKKLTKRHIILTLLGWVIAMSASAQLKGVVVDSYTGETIVSPTIKYTDKGIAVVGDEDGRFEIDRIEGEQIVISAVGYKQQKVNVRRDTPEEQVYKLKPDTKHLDEVVVKSKKKSKYSRKNNPAVELMKRVVAAKKRTDLANHDYYQYDKYQKITFAVNDISPDEILDDTKKKPEWFADQVEFCEWNEKFILPLTVDETVSKHIYRKEPNSEKDIVLGQRSNGINKLIETGEMVNSMLKDVFTDVDLYDDQVRLLQYPFTSPIGKDAVAFYRFYIEDTTYVGADRCYHLQFFPNNQQDFGFRGEIYVLADSTLHLRKANITIPKRSDVNFVENLKLQQEYELQPNGEWVLTIDNMLVEMSLTNFLTKAVVIRTTRLHDYAFEPIDDNLFKGKTKIRYNSDAKMKGDEFWSEHRQVELTKSESSMNTFLQRMQQTKGFKWIMFGVRAVVENFIESGTPATKSKFDIGPVNTLISKNFVDGIRLRASGQTTASLNPHLFWKGYYAYGTKSKKSYYSSLVTYSFNKKEYQPSEFPSRTISFETSYDVMSPSDKFLVTDKDNVFTAFRWTKVDQMYFYNRQKLKFDWETDWGFRTTFHIKTESNEPTGELAFRHINDGTQVKKIRTSEAMLSFVLCPGRTYVNTKQNRWPTNYDNPEFSLSHTIGFDGFLGGRYKYNYTEAGIYKRFWMKSWGKIDARLKAGAQWNKVPFPLLILPPTNLSFVSEAGTFALMNNMEFLTDRYAMIDIGWDMNGKIFNRIPFLRRLKWREFVGVKGMIGYLTEKNNPFLEKNFNDGSLFIFPEGANTMEKGRPYWEMVVGIHNIFKFFSVDYVRRLSYNDLPTAHKHGLRFAFEFTF